MKIAVDGSFSTGKTTLFNELIKLYPDFYSIEEASRGLLCEFNLSTMADLKGDQKVLFEQKLIAKQISLESENPNFIVDLSLIANLAYKTNVQSVDEDLSKKVSEFVKNGVGYDLIFYIPIDGLIRDGLRHEDAEFRNFIDQEIKNMHLQYNITPIILSGSVDQRLEIAKKTIDKLLKI